MTELSPTAAVVEACAREAHEENRRYCESIDDPVPAPWHEMSEEHRAGMRSGVALALEGRTPREMHEAWCASKRRAGWVHGQTKDEHQKTHPNLVDYDGLPPQQKVKDVLFSAIVRAVARALGRPDET